MNNRKPAKSMKKVKNTDIFSVFSFTFEFLKVNLVVRNFYASCRSYKGDYGFPVSIHDLRETYPVD